MPKSSWNPFLPEIFVAYYFFMIMLSLKQLAFKKILIKKIYASKNLETKNSEQKFGAKNMLGYKKGI